MLGGHLVVSSAEMMVVLMVEQLAGQMDDWLAALKVEMRDE